MIHCTLCRKDKPADDFAPSNVYQGTTGQCRSCMTLYRALRAQGTHDAKVAVRRAQDPVECRSCHQLKPCEEITPNHLVPTCFACDVKARAEAKRQNQAERRAELTPEEKAEASRAYRAGMRKDKCAVCGTSMQGHGVCVTCEECIEVLGGLEGLRRAVKAERYLSEKRG